MSAAEDLAGQGARESLELDDGAEDNFEVDEDSLLGETDMIDESATAYDDPELETIKLRVKALEQEAEKLKEMQKEEEDQMSVSTVSTGVSGNGPLSVTEKKEIDERSVYVGNVDYKAGAKELEAHFHGCGPINRVTILQDKFTGHPKGFAYIEFNDKSAVEMAKALCDSLFMGRQIKVLEKRTNEPGISSTNRRPRGRFRPRGRGPPRGYDDYYQGGGYGGGYGGGAGGGYYPRRPRGGRFRPRSNWYSPY